MYSDVTTFLYVTEETCLIRNKAYFHEILDMYWSIAWRKYRHATIQIIVYFHSEKLETMNEIYNVVLRFYCVMCIRYYNYIKYSISFYFCFMTHKVLYLQSGGNWIKFISMIIFQFHQNLFQIYNIFLQIGIFYF